jgi:amidase
MRPPSALRTAVAVLLAGAASLPATARQRTAAPVTVVESSIDDLRLAMEAGRTTSRALTAQYLERIARYDGRLRATISLNPRALDQAATLDAERRRGRVRGPLHGIPIALKDNIQTRDMPTTGGALVFAGLRPPYDATVTRRLRDAGAVILAKTSMTELANWVASAMPAGYGSLHGFSFNPYAPAQRSGTARQETPVLSPGGSSSGIGTAASLWAASVGTETSGSILNPSSQTMLVGIKPTVGRVSRYGVIPITSDQDTPGPMARSVADAALLLGAMESPAPDPADPATRACTPPPGRDYTAYLDPDALHTARIGVPRAFFYTRVAPPHAGGPIGGLTGPEAEAMTEAIDVLRRAGATVVDPSNLPSITTDAGARSLLEWPICIGAAARGARADCSLVLAYGMKRDFTAWLQSLGRRAPVKTLTELRAWNRAHAAEGTLRFGQDQLDASDSLDVQNHRARYLEDLDKDRRLTRQDGIDAALQADRLDALLFPSFYGSSVAARAGYPSVIVPFALLPSDTPGPGRRARTPATPFGVTFTGTACSEPRLIAMAYAFEQATRRRVPPDLEQ